MSQTPLDEFRAQVAAEQDPRPARRRMLLLALVGLVAGLVLGYVVAQFLIVPTVPQTIELSRPEQDDYILMVAEAYAVDRNVELAQQRLARLNDPRTTERIIALAKEYAPQRDYVAQRLAVLAVAAGSQDQELVLLASTLVAPTPTATPTPLSTRSSLLAGTAEPPQTVYVVVTGEPTATPTIFYVVVTGEPTFTPTPVPPTLFVATWTPTPIVLTDEQRPDVILPMPVNFTEQRVAVNVPVYTGMPSAEIRLGTRPANCTPADQMPPVVTASLLLCAGQTYAPFVIQGNNLTVYGDPERTALIKGESRRFAITAEGTNISLVGLHVEGVTHDADFESWLCLYPRCNHTPEIGGAVGYGGGVLLKNTSNAAVVDSQFNGGTVGVFVLEGFSNKLLNNSFATHNGWGALMMQTRSEYVVGNRFDQINRSCTGLDNVYHVNGCESSGLAMTHVRNTLVYNNTCRRVSNCYYANGDGGYGSTGIKFYNNKCAGALNNCFEVTFGVGHEFDYNSAVFDAEAAQPCDYPFWIGGSTAYFGPNNQWDCLHDYDTSVNDARTKTIDKATELLALAERPTPTTTPTFVRGAPAVPAILRPTDAR